MHCALLTFMALCIGYQMHSLVSDWMAWERKWG